MDTLEGKTEAETGSQEILWTEGALKRMERAPVFLRGMVKRLAEKKARELGYRAITEDLLTQFKDQMMGKMGGETGLYEAAGAMAAAAARGAHAGRCSGSTRGHEHEKGGVFGGIGSRP
jgi:hypothetical protein